MIPSASSPEYTAMQRAWRRRFPGRSMKDVTPADEYRVVRFAGGEIGGTGAYLVDFHVVDSRGRTQRVFSRRRSVNAPREAHTYARRLNVHLARVRLLA